MRCGTPGELLRTALLLQCVRFALHMHWRAMDRAPMGVCFPRSGVPSAFAWHLPRHRCIYTSASFMSPHVHGTSRGSRRCACSSCTLTHPQRQCYAAGRAASVLFENARCSTVSWRLLKGTGCLRGKSKLYNCGVQWQSPVQTLIQVVLRVLQFTVCQHQLPNQMRHGSSVPPGTYVAH